MPRIRFGLQARFVAACLLLVSISTSGFVVAIARVIEVLELELRDTTLREELQQFAEGYARDPLVQGPRAARLYSYVVRADGGGDVLPPALRALTPGLHIDVFVDGHEVAVGRQDVRGARLYVVRDLESLHRLESRFIALAWIFVVVSALAAVTLAVALSRRVMGPVTQLASRVGQWQPGTPQAPLTPQFGDREIGLIAAAFDRFIERLDEFVAREQAFTEDASHELRTPLAVIDSAAQLLAEDNSLSASARDRVQRILRAAQQMQMMIEALLFLSREQGGQAQQDLALHQLAQEIAANYRELIGSKPLELVLHTEPTRLMAPRGMAACVISNLLLNAIHHSERGRIEVQVRPGCLRVQDTGIGIAPDDLARIFERRFRGPQSRGLGLGLYLVRRICDRLGWTLQVSSTAGLGTCFEIGFPRDNENLTNA